jgi:hypothetical protein
MIRVRKDQRLLPACKTTPANVAGRGDLVESRAVAGWAICALQGKRAVLQGKRCRVSALCYRVSREPERLSCRVSPVRKWPGRQPQPTCRVNLTQWARRYCGVNRVLLGLAPRLYQSTTRAWHERVTLQWHGQGGAAEGLGTPPRCRVVGSLPCNRTWAKKKKKRAAI